MGFLPCQVSPCQSQGWPRQWLGYKGGIGGRSREEDVCQAFRFLFPLHRQGVSLRTADT